MKRELKTLLVKSQFKIRCHCNDESCQLNKTCETDGFCYQNLLLQNRNGRTIKKTVRGCSKNKHIDFYYCKYGSNKINFVCCSRDYCNNLPGAKFKLNLRNNLYFFGFFFLFSLLILLSVLLIKKVYRRKKKKRHFEAASDQKTRSKPKLKDQLEYLGYIKKGKFKESFCGRRLGEKLFIKEFSQKTKQNWQNEVETYSLPLLRHENIVDFLGKDHLLIVTIYYENGSLTDFLAKNRKLNEGQLIELMLSAALGLNHLHQNLEFKPPIAHRKLDSDHFIVVVSSQLRCKLTNFSEALTYPRYEKLEKEHNLKQLRRIVCDPKYCPPEYFSQTINLKSFIAFLNADIYSFSLILWQIANHYSTEKRTTDVSVSQIITGALENKAYENNTSKLCEQNHSQTNGRRINENYNSNAEGKQITLDEAENQNDFPDFRYSKPYEEYFYGDVKPEFEQMKELLKDEFKEDSLINRPTIYFEASKISTFNGYVITKLIDECWSPKSCSRLSIAKIVKELTDLHKTNMANKNNWG